GYVRCLACETPYHLDCWGFNGRCAVYGCESERSAWAADARVRVDTMVMEAEDEVPPRSFRISGALSRSDAAHLGIVLLPLLWVPILVDGGWLLLVNLAFVAFPLLMYAFQVRNITLESGGMALGYLFWTRRVAWPEVRGLALDPLCGYRLLLSNGETYAVMAEPGELDDLEQAVEQRLASLAADHPFARSGL
ncbi:MAG: hypothetical protein HY814_04960, partial [Candidatus Riflebacteria bacterium]|nr:hypothetical protein [Candidatus Riflebacteria bacterium]